MQKDIVETEKKWQESNLAVGSHIHIALFGVWYVRDCHTVSECARYANNSTTCILHRRIINSLNLHTFCIKVKTTLVSTCKGKLYKVPGMPVAKYAHGWPKMQAWGVCSKSSSYY